MKASLLKVLEPQTQEYGSEQQIGRPVCSDCQQDCDHVTCSLAYSGETAFSFAVAAFSKTPHVIQDAAAALCWAQP